MKKAIKFMLKEAGINKFIAFKSMHLGAGHKSFYSSIKSMLNHKWSNEDILCHFNWVLYMTKDFAQF